MGNPTEKPNFEKLASIIHDKGEMAIAQYLGEMYECGYHVGLIYGWGQGQDEDYQADLSLATYKDGKRKEQALEEAIDELRELDIVGELDEILGKDHAKRYSGVEDELDPFDPV